jgi:uncharacterized spore protein YtfJ
VQVAFHFGTGQAIAARQFTRKEPGKGLGSGARYFLHCCAQFFVMIEHSYRISTIRDSGECYRQEAFRRVGYDEIGLTVRTKQRKKNRSQKFKTSQTFEVHNFRW